MHIGENGFPESELILEKDTDKPNGTKIEVSVAKGDEYDFSQAIINQIGYFRNIHVVDDYNTGYSNDYRIIEGDTFKLRSIDRPYHNMHMCIGDVTYPIDWREISGFDSVIQMIPVAIKFKIGELQPTPARESVMYSPKSIQIIKDKINAFLVERDNIFDEQIKPVNTLKEYFDLIKQGNTYNLTFGDITIPSSLFGNKETVRIKDFPVSIITIINNSGYYAGYNNRLYTFNHFSGSYFNLTSDLVLSTILYKDETPDYYKERYIQEETKYRGTIFSKKLTLKNYIKLLNLKNFKKNQWRSIIKKFQELEFEYIKDVKKISEVIVDAEWLKEAKEAKRLASMSARELRKQNKEILIYQPRSADRGGGKSNYVFDKNSVKYKDLKKYKGLYIYGTKQEDLVIQFNELLFRNQRYKFIQMGKQNFKHVEDLPNFITIDEFMEKADKFLRDAATYSFIQGKIRKLKEDKNDSLFLTFFETKWSGISYKINSNRLLNTDSEFLTVKDFSSNLYDSFENFVSWYKLYYEDYGAKRDLLQKLFQTLEAKYQNNLNQERIEQFEYLLESFEKYKLLNVINGGLSYLNLKKSEYKDISRFLSKVKGERINNYWYLKDEYNPVLKQLINEN
jgi:hypothetical protein